MSDTDDDFDLNPRKRRRVEEVHYERPNGKKARIILSDSESETHYKSDSVWRRREDENLEHPSNVQAFTRLTPDAWTMLVEWCNDNAQRIEQQREKERRENEQKLDSLKYLLGEYGEEIEDLERQIRAKKRKKEEVKRMILLKTDAASVLSATPFSLEKKLFMFASVMSVPPYGLDTMKRQFWYSDRTLLKCFHQALSAMRLLHEDFVEAPKREDRKFKPRKPHRGKWQVLQDTSHDPSMIKKFERVYLVSMEDVRMACTALQNLLFVSQNLSECD